eukprot:8103266-Karenia_brevis.AAC.1
MMMSMMLMIMMMMLLMMMLMVMKWKNISREFVNCRHPKPRRVLKGDPVHWAENSVLVDLFDPCRTFALGPFL